MTSAPDYDGIHSCGPTCERPECVAARATPRVDEAARAAAYMVQEEWNNMDYPRVVTSTFARQLERSLNAALKRIAELERATSTPEK